MKEEFLQTLQLSTPLDLLLAPNNLCFTHVPLSTILPSSRTNILSQFTIVESLCAIISDVLSRHTWGRVIIRSNYSCSKDQLVKVSG